MSRIEELPDDYEEPSLPTTSTQSAAPTSKPSPTKTTTQNGSTKPTTTPDLPPLLSDTHHQTVDQVLADLKRTPFFMTSLDDAGDEPNPELDAIKALLYEGTRAEIALNFKTQGNEQISAKQPREAKELYTKGLAALDQERGPSDPTGPEEDTKELSTREVLLANRAAAHLALQNFRSAAADCMRALELNPGLVKAAFRLATALYSLGRYAEALSAVQAGLALDPSNAAMLALQTRISEGSAAAARKEQARTEREENARLVHRTLATALQARQILVRGTKDRPDLPDGAELKLVPDPLSMTSTLVFPVVLLYPLHAQSDVVREFGEEQSLAGHLGYLLPLPWDERGEYGEDEGKMVEAYLETREGGLVKWGRNVELLKVLSGGRVVVLDGIVRVNVVPKVRAQEWIAEVKRRKSKA